MVCSNGSSKPVWNISATIKIRYGSFFSVLGILASGKPHSNPADRQVIGGSWPSYLHSPENAMIVYMGYVYLPNTYWWRNSMQCIVGILAVTTISLVPAILPLEITQLTLKMVYHHLRFLRYCVCIAFDKRAQFFEPFSYRTSGSSSTVFMSL